MSSKQRVFTIGALSKVTGCNIETIRYYEKIGLLSEPDRTPGGHRVYNASDGSRLQFILKSRELGFPINEIRKLLVLVDGQKFTCGEVKELTERHIRDIKNKVKDLRKLERALSGLVVQCEGGNIPDCPIIESLWVDPN